MNEHVLKTELALTKYSTMSDINALADLQNQNISVKTPISTQDIKQYLILNGIWMQVKTANTIASNTAMDALKEFSSFDVTNPSIETVLINILDGLVIDVLEFTTTHKNAILGMGNKLVSRSEQLNIVDVTLGDVMRARL